MASKTTKTAPPKKAPRRPPPVIDGVAEAVAPTLEERGSAIGTLSAKLLAVVSEGGTDAVVLSASLGSVLAAVALAAKYPREVMTAAIAVAEHTIAAASATAGPGA